MPKSTRVRVRVKQGKGWETLLITEDRAAACDLYTSLVREGKACEIADYEGAANGNL